MGLVDRYRTVGVEHKRHKESAVSSLQYTSRSSVWPPVLTVNQYLSVGRQCSWKAQVYRGIEVIWYRK